MAKTIPVCTPKQLSSEVQLLAAKQAVEVNPANAPSLDIMPLMSVALTAADAHSLPERLAFVTSRYWGSGGVDLTVSFLDNPTPGFRNKWLAHANSWGEFCNVRFRWTQTGGQVRLARLRGMGYWSYVGVDILNVPANEQTMNLDSFTESTSEKEWTRVVRHEVGHTIGCPHEHLRQAMIDRLDARKVIAEFRRTQGWDEQTIRFNLLTPLEERSILGSELTDEDSIMTYQLGGNLTKDGKPIRGGNDFSATDKVWAAKVYPRSDVPPPPPPPPVTSRRTIVVDWEAKKLLVDGKEVT